MRHAPFHPVAVAAELGVQDHPVARQILESSELSEVQKCIAVTEVVAPFQHVFESDIAKSSLKARGVFHRIFAPFRAALSGARIASAACTWSAGGGRGAARGARG